jgi:hypothetical protein
MILSIYLESVPLKLSFLSFFKICILQNWDYFLHKSYPHVSRIPRWPPLPLNGTLCLFGWPPPCKMQDDLFLANIFHVKHKMMHTFVNLHKSSLIPTTHPWTLFPNLPLHKLKWKKTSWIYPFNALKYIPIVVGKWNFHIVC